VTADATVENTALTETVLARPAYVMAAGEFKASDLIGDNIVGVDGKTIATVADVLIGNDMSPSHIVSVMAASWVLPVTSAHCRSAR
jgi:hypothetical protein